MVAVLQYIPEDDYFHVEPVRAPVVPLHVVPSTVVPTPGVPSKGVVSPESRAVHRQPSPRVTRSHSAAVYWRRRLVATAFGLGVLLTAAHAGAALGGTTTTAPERSPHVTTIVAAPGDTLWSIAHRLAPNADPRGVVDALARSHGGSDVQPGDAFSWAK
jgi:LysM repeat protein